VAILNYDDVRVRAMASRTRARVITYAWIRTPTWLPGRGGRSRRAILYRLCQGLFPVPDRKGERKLGVKLPLLGRHNVYAALAAVAVGLALDVPLEDALEALAGVGPLPGRLNPLPGLDGSLVLDDSFDASLASTLAALEALALFKRGRRFCRAGRSAQPGSA